MIFRRAKLSEQPYESMELCSGLAAHHSSRVKAIAAQKPILATIRAKSSVGGEFGPRHLYDLFRTTPQQSEWRGRRSLPRRRLCIPSTFRTSGHRGRMTSCPKRDVILEHVGQLALSSVYGPFRPLRHRMLSAESRIAFVAVDALSDFAAVGGQEIVDYAIRKRMVQQHEDGSLSVSCLPSRGDCVGRMVRHSDNASSSCC